MATVSSEAGGEITIPTFKKAHNISYCLLNNLRQEAERAVRYYDIVMLYINGF